MKVRHVIAVVNRLCISCSFLFFAGSVVATPVNEAAMYAEIEQLRRFPDESARSWLQELVEYQSVERYPAAEHRGSQPLPRYPIAAAARSALRALDTQQTLNSLRSSATDSAPLPTQDAPIAVIRAWQHFLSETPLIPSRLLDLSRDDDRLDTIPEALLLSLAQHPAASPAWTLALLTRGTQGNSLRWLDGQITNLSLEQLHSGSANRAIASSIWREISRRANSGDSAAVQSLRQVIRERPGAPGLADGLAHWSAAIVAIDDERDASMSKSTQDARSRLRLQVQHRQLRKHKDTAS